MFGDPMMLTPFWKWDNALPASLLDVAMSDFCRLDFSDGLLHEARVAPDEVRKSKVAMLNPSYWLCGILFNYAVLANKSAGWGCEIDLPETIQVAVYERGGHYNWHADTNFLSNKPLARKLTSVCLLNDRGQFVGGDFEIEGYSEPIRLDAGSVIVFPSVLRHRVTPVEFGVRYSATCWALGPKRW